MNPDFKNNKFYDLVNPAINKLCDELKKMTDINFHELKYESGDEEWTFKERISLGLYFEFIKAGIINNEPK